MKVISGTLKGRNIIGFQNPGTRPTMDRVKESLFAMIQEDLPDSIILDVFSGSGSLAIEALSQGASCAFCNDKNKKAYQIIRKNIEQFSLQSKTQLMNLDFKKLFLLLGQKNQKFDLIFLDPPYQTEYIKESLLLIEKYQLLKEEGKIICESDSLEKIPLGSLWQIVKQKKYGDKLVVILTRK